MSEAAPYEALAAVIERELTLVEARDFTGLSALKRERAAIVRALPATPPAGARAALLRCDGLQKRVTVELHRVRESLLLELRQVQLARRTASGYRPPVARVASFSRLGVALHRGAAARLRAAAGQPPAARAQDPRAAADNPERPARSGSNRVAQGGPNPR